METVDSFKKIGRGKTVEIFLISLGITKQVAITSGFGIHILSIAYFLVLGVYGLLKLKFKK